MISETQTIIAALGGFILRLIVLALVMKLAAPGMIIHEAKSPYDFNTTVETIIANLW